MRRYTLQSMAVAVIKNMAERELVATYNNYKAGEETLVSMDDLDDFWSAAPATAIINEVVGNPNFHLGDRWLVEEHTFGTCATYDKLEKVITMDVINDMAYSFVVCGECYGSKDLVTLFKAFPEDEDD